MGIRVKCPNGHVFKVKDKYSGRKGLCPKCPTQVVVQVPDAYSLLETEAEATHRSVVAEEVRAAQAAASEQASSVLDDSLHEGASSSGSLLGSSVIQHNLRCECGQSVPMWFAKCPGCGKFIERR